MAWAQRAHRAAADKREQLAEDMNTMNNELDIINQRLEDCDASELPLTMSSASWSPDDLRLFDRLFHDPAFRSRKRIDDLRVVAMATPLPLVVSPSTGRHACVGSS